LFPASNQTHNQLHNHQHHRSPISPCSIHKFTKQQINQRNHHHCSPASPQPFIPCISLLSHTQHRRALRPLLGMVSPPLLPPDATVAAASAPLPVLDPLT
jgi:hypothetical protein